MRRLPVRPPGQAAALEEGHVDAVFPSEPFYSQISQIEENSVISNPVRETRAGMPITLWAATQQWPWVLHAALAVADEGAS